MTTIRIVRYYGQLQGGLHIPNEWCPVRIPEGCRQIRGPPLKSMIPNYPHSQCPQQQISSTTPAPGPGSYPRPPLCRQHQYIIKLVWPEPSEKAQGKRKERTPELPGLGRPGTYCPTTPLLKDNDGSGITLSWKKWPDLELNQRPPGLGTGPADHDNTSPQIATQAVWSGAQHAQPHSVPIGNSTVTQLPALIVNSISGKNVPHQPDTASQPFRPVMPGMSIG
ncbi:hypothetical protein FIBSPDRAFT_886018 [Athelia psychrophila]|uniref:Uncharacterized protein n=1 Tax=Athelia psychrophila TaxID=1759441 RepID=A0A166RCU4_9AGAM|nr:hypothetical protein FIBSPDRAFT_886018 [Fibularhizoctonia sp. CBS 109695]